MMFHVKPICSFHASKWIALISVVFFLLSSCTGSRQTTQISDYILVPNGQKILGNNESLTAFIFENNTRNLPIERFLAIKFRTENYLNSTYPVNIDNNKYQLILYDNADFEKYFNSANYSVIHLQPQDDQTDQQRKFIAWSLINSNNEDCLREDSLFQNVAVNYLKKLKEEYYNQ
ncbi:hypothetical protein G4D82_02690 [Flavobacterium sp. CYK-4]|uniref:hypothetical protein n=1 Tax=Flavobacterium lotistagni TaxID=2709660 RepID=UPI0014085244|nr:hypothetical protein [Flavobacterium lotistagni]NHM06117.1 hypothetical protein [Flavobacterium lotistagni]